MNNFCFDVKNSSAHCSSPFRAAVQMWTNIVKQWVALSAGWGCQWIIMINRPLPGLPDHQPGVQLWCWDQWDKKSAVKHSIVRRINTGCCEALCFMLHERDMEDNTHVIQDILLEPDALGKPLNRDIQSVARSMIQIASIRLNRLQLFPEDHSY